jgi:ferrous iron transport protein B
MTRDTEPNECTIALAGNPNSGKSCIFNSLTGSHQHVGNYPGVTVERKDGMFKHGDIEYKLVDLPGIYSLTSFSLEEVVARKFLITDKPSVVINVIDASNLERNLYLTIQLLEMGMNVVVALNMMDEVKKAGTVLDTDMISSRLGCPVVETVGHQGKGVEPLKQAVTEAFSRGRTDTVINYRDELGVEVSKLCALMGPFEDIPYLHQFAAIKLLENDTEVIARFKHQPGHDALFEQVEKSVARMENLYGYPPEVLIGDRRYGFASGLVREVTISRPVIDRISMTEKIDSIVTSRFLAIPLFLLTMYVIFWLTFTLGAPFMNWIDAGFIWLSGVIQAHWPAGTLPWMKSLIVDGVIGGVGGVLVFMPNIVFLFMGISFLEDTGYMARIAFIMDRIMHRIGLHGRSFIPLMIGFGCTVPAIMATRTIRSEKTRLTTMMILPLMSCGARMPIYLMVIPAFFPEGWHTPILWSIYVIGVLLALIVARFLRKTLLKGEAEPFVMELPPYRMPSLKAVLLHMWEKSWLYLKKAGTIILAVSILMWILLTFPQKQPDSAVQTPSVNALEYSFAGRIGHAIEPAIRPMGFDWRIGTSFLGAFAAKELFVTQMGIVFSLDNVDESAAGRESLRTLLRKKYTPLIGFCILLFALIATPCMATLAVTRKEAGSMKWAVFQWTFLTGLGWVITTLVYQLGRLFLH